VNGRNSKGQFIAGHPLARELGKKGFQATVDKHWAGDAKAYLDWLTAKGLYSLDKYYEPALQKFSDPDAELIEGQSPYVRELLLSSA
jgi:hypothetical protein